MKNLFKHASSSWVVYSKYEWKRDRQNRYYITPAPNAVPRIYDPLKNYQAMVVEALNIGLIIRTASQREIRTAIMKFVSTYGLLGMMTALPTTPQFIDYNAVYFPTNHFIREESLSTGKYLDMFFPFEKPNFKKQGKKSVLHTDDRTMIALQMTFRKEPTAQVLCFMRNYAERYDWLKQMFRDWSFTFLSSFLYYEDYDHLDEAERDIYRQGMATFEGIAPGYHIELRERATIVWDFHSLLLAIQMMFNFMLVDETSALKLCRNCSTAYWDENNDKAFCSEECAAEYTDEE